MLWQQCTPIAAATLSKHQSTCCRCLPCVVVQGRKLLLPNSRPGSSSSRSSSSNGGGNPIAAALAAAAQSAASLALSAGVDVAAGTLDFFLMEWFDRDRDNMW